MDNSQVIIKPVLTESAYVAQESGKYYFWVNKFATKSQIAAAFKSIFNQQPLAVNTLNTLGKIKTNWKSRQKFSKSDRKKAIITIDKSKKIEILQLKEPKK